jgi:hypothetical protein
MQKAKACFGIACQAIPVSAHGFEQVEGADDIGLDEVLGAVDRAVHMAFGGKVDDGARLVPGQQVSDEFTVTDVTLQEAVARIAL